MSYFGIKKDSTTLASTTIDYVHHEVHDGDSFMYEDVVTLASSGSLAYMITTGSTAKWAHFGYDIECIGPMTFELYEGCDRTGSVVQTTWNRDRNSSSSPVTIIHKGVTGGSTDGTRIRWWQGGVNNNKTQVGGNPGTSREIILKQSTKYEFKLLSGMADNITSIRFDWYEHTNVS